MNLLITICARGGSKGIPKKNIHLINGIPLIAYTIAHAQQYAENTGADIDLSTDDEEIKQVAKEVGLTTDYVRPEALGSDMAGKLETIADVVNFAEQSRKIRYDMILDLDVTSPLRTQDDLHAGLEMMHATPNARNLFSVSAAEHNPYFDMVEENAEGFFELVKKPGEQMRARQEGPHVFDLNASFYFYRREFFDETPLTLIGNSLAYVMPHMCFELDDLLQCSFLEYLLKEQKLDFDFQY